MVVIGVNAALAVKEAGEGFTVMVNSMGIPLQPVLFNGVTVIVAVTRFIVLFTAVNEGISPVPLAASPIPGVSLAQLNVLAVPVKLTGAVADPFSGVCGPGVFAIGIAFTTPLTATG